MNLSVLELAPVGTGYTAQQALANALELARLAERLGYVRYWFAEHHGMPSIASSAPEILIAHVSAHTQTIRVGSGGIMMQNHVPLKLAKHSTRSRRCIRGASTWASVARRAPTRRRRVHCVHSVRTSS